MDSETSSHRVTCHPFPAIRSCHKTIEAFKTEQMYERFCILAPTFPLPWYVPRRLYSFCVHQIPLQADVIGIASGALSLLETVFTVIERLNDAKKRTREHKQLLANCSSQVSTTKATIQLVKDEPALQTAVVTATLQESHSILEDFTAKIIALEALENSKPIKQYGHHLFHGKNDEKEIQEFTDALTRWKQTLLLDIGVANVGISRKNQQTLLANVDLIEAVNAKLQALGEGAALKIAEVIRGRDRDGTSMGKFSFLTN